MGFRGQLALQQFSRAKVRSGSLAAAATPFSDVRLSSESGHPVSRFTRPRKMTVLIYLLALLHVFDFFRRRRADDGVGDGDAVDHLVERDRKSRSARGRLGKSFERGARHV